jgi:xylan 1,4-beta-xylosidase
VTLEIAGLPRGVPQVTHYRIDAQHSNAYAAWQRMGSPATLDKAAYDALRAAGQLSMLEKSVAERAAGGKWRLEFVLPRQAVSLIVFSQSR